MIGQKASLPKKIITTDLSKLLKLFKTNTETALFVNEQTPVSYWFTL